MSIARRGGLNFRFQSIQALRKCCASSATASGARWYMSPSASSDTPVMCAHCGMWGPVEFGGDATVHEDPFSGVCGPVPCHKQAFVLRQGLPWRHRPGNDSELPHGSDCLPGPPQQSRREPHYTWHGPQSSCRRYNNNSSSSRYNNNNNKVARASAAARGVSFIFRWFFGRKLENPVFGVVFVNNTMFRCFRFPLLFVLVSC